MDYGALLETARKVHARSGKGTLVSLADIVACGFRYQAGYMDYLVFEFDRLTAAQRATYITRGKNNAYVRLLNPVSYTHLILLKRTVCVLVLSVYVNLQKQDLR